MIGKDVKLIKYSKKTDTMNCLTHALGAVFSVVATYLLINKATGVRHTLSGVIYGFSLIAVYTVSAIYHGLPQGETKRILRIADHCTVPLLIAGTAAPCALISLYNISHIHGVIIFVLSHLCTFFGIFSKIFFFERLKKLTMTIYIVCGSIMLFSALPILDKINTDAFMQLVVGSILYVIGAVFCGLGVKRPFFHIIFHILVLIASMLHFYTIYNFII